MHWKSNTCHHNAPGSVRLLFCAQQMPADKRLAGEHVSMERLDKVDMNDKLNSGMLFYNSNIKAIVLF